MAKPQVTVMSGYVINCEEETKFAFETFEQLGAKGNIVHINDLIASKMLDAQILVFPGGFSYGDDTGSGNAYANRVRNHLWDIVLEFVQKDHLVIGICNGFQIIANLGLVPAIDGKYGERSVALTHNNLARYSDRWVDIQFYGDSPWVRNLDVVSMPIAHGEGRFFTEPDTLKVIQNKKLVAGRGVGQ